MPALRKSHRREMAARLRRAGGFTLIETLAVLLVVGVLFSIMMGARGIFSSGRESTAVQELASVIESARSQAMRGVGDVWVAFAIEGNEESHRRYALCEQVGQIGQDEDLRPFSAWHMMPVGCVLTNCPPAMSDAGRNFLSALSEQQRIQTNTTAGGQYLNCYCLRFGSRGQLLSPDTEGRPLLLALAEGIVSDSGPQALDGSRHKPEKCLWVSVQPATGKVTLLQ